MSDRDRVERDIAMTFDFLRYLIGHPEMLDDISDGSEIEFIGPEITVTESTETPRDRKPTVISTKRVFELLSPS